MSISEGKLSPVHGLFFFKKIPIAAASCAWLRPVTSWVVVGWQCLSTWNWQAPACLAGQGQVL